MGFSIKLQEINLYVCEEYKTEREAQRLNRALKLASEAHYISLIYWPLLYL